MHELALMTAVIERVCDIARTEHAARITDVRLVCGETSGVVPEALEFCFDVCAADTPAQNAKLHIEKAQGRAFFLKSIDVE